MRAAANKAARRFSVRDASDRIPKSNYLPVEFKGARTRGQDPSIGDEEFPPIPTPSGSGHEFTPIAAPTSGATPLRIPDNPSPLCGGYDRGVIRRGARRSAIDDPDPHV
ncbi:hypothetical protein AB0C34_19830 [Nocardia sp. NPDC049220]|uniref:hypothetical protein n=1 Tax=Nocardia sp. NPDC049220 TaxID=3155273 RepID=UPI0033E80E63